MFRVRALRIHTQGARAEDTLLYFSNNLLCIFVVTRPQAPPLHQNLQMNEYVWYYYGLLLHKEINTDVPSRILTRLLRVYKVCRKQI